ncbi:MAG: DEAD/DEAH box helicase family protein [archaeon]|nr:DEAD/DEAH box helicase family protein [archaeon]
MKILMGFLSEKLETHDANDADDIINATLLSMGLYQGNHVGYGRGRGAKIPADYQYIPWDMLNTRWLSSIESEMNEEQKTIHRKNHERKRILIADEGGLGKTFSACICAAKVIAEGQSVLIVTPPALRDTWVAELSSFQIPIFKKRTAQSLFQPLEPGFAYVVSRGSIQKESQFSEEIHSHLRDIGLVIVDEAHYGMIASSAEETVVDGHLDEESQALFKQRLSPFILLPRQVLCLTATPMRKGWKDLRELIALLDEEEGLVSLANLWVKDDDWISKLGTDWLLPLGDYVESSTMNLERDEIQQRLATYAPHIQDEFKPLVVQILTNGANLETFNRARLVRDLHPLGKYFHCTVRDDLGLDLVNQSFRKRLDKRVDFSQEDLPFSNKFGKNMPKIAQACISNLLDTNRYTSLDGIAHELGIDKDSISNSWIDDPRHKELITMLDGECRAALSLEEPEQRGCVVFAHHVGTQLQLYESIDHKFSEYEGVKVIKTYSDDEDLTHPQSRYRVQALLKECERDAEKGIFVILVCGDSLAEGQSFLWANSLINWDLHGGAENIAQRSWRLDRMLPRNRPFPPYSPTFKIIHFVVTETDQYEKINEVYRLNRTILGERRFIDAGAQLIPHVEGEHPSIWTENPRVIGLLDDVILRERNWANGVGESTLEEASEQLWHRALANLMSWGDFLPEWDEDNRDVLEEIPGQDGTLIRDWIRLIWCGDRNERRSLRRLRGKKNPDDLAIPRAHGPPSTEHHQEILQLLPNGRIPNSLIQQSIVKESNNVVQYNSNTWIAASINFLIGRTQNEILKQELYWGDDLPSGLFIADNVEGPWRIITKRELKTDMDLRTRLVQLSRRVESTLMKLNYETRFDIPNNIEFNGEVQQPGQDNHLNRVFEVLTSARRRLPNDAAELMFEDVMKQCPLSFVENEKLRIIIGGR